MPGAVPSDGCPSPVVHIIDDDVPLGAALANLLRSLGFAVALFTTPEAFLEAWQPEHCGCLLLDLRFPSGSGLDHLADFGEAGVGMPVILMTGHADVTTSVRGMKAGAVDYLVKPFDDDELIRALDIALERDAAKRQRESDLSDVVARYESLTSREKQVMALVVSGLMNKQVAGKLNLSEITVKVHRGTMMRKMGLRTLADLVRADEALGTARG